MTTWQRVWNLVQTDPYTQTALGAMVLVVGCFVWVVLTWSVLATVAFAVALGFAFITAMRLLRDARRNIRDLESG